MSEPQATATIHRVLVAMDSPSALDLLPVATELAARLQAELLGLFVENRDLLRLCDLPFAQEICSTSAVLRPLTPESIERRLQSLAEQLRISLAESARRAQVTWSFHVQRGSVFSIGLESTGEADILLFGSRAGWPSQPADRTAAGRGPELPSLPVVVVFDGSAAAYRALAVACQISRATAVPPTVILAGPDDAVERLKRDAADVLRQQGFAAHFEAQPVTRSSQLPGIVARRASLLVLIPGDVGWQADLPFSKLAATLTPPLGIVR